MDGYQLPAYSVSQDDTTLFVELFCPESVPGVRPAVAAEGCAFGFRLDPYYLPLVLPHPVLQAVGGPSLNDGRWLVALPKAQAGLEYDNLDQLEPRLLPDEQLMQAMADAEAGKGFFRDAAAPQSNSTVHTDSSASDQVAARSLLQQAMSKRGLVSLNEHDETARSGEERMTASPDLPSARSDLKYTFGLHGEHQDPLLPPGVSDSRGLLEVEDPSCVEPAERLRIAIAYEDDHWDEGIYMDNFLDQQEEIAHSLRFRPHVPARPLSPHTASSGRLPDDSFKLCLLVQLLFAYCYDNRTNDGEATVESGWNITKLCRTLTASVVVADHMSFKSNLLATMIGCARRALTVPLYRHWQLTRQCLVLDTVACLKAGRSYIVTCLNEIRLRLEQSQDAILTRLALVWVTPLLNAVPDDTKLQKAGQMIEELDQEGLLTRNSVGGAEWDLEVLEVAAQQALDDGEGGFV